MPRFLSHSTKARFSNTATGQRLVRHAPWIISAVLVLFKLWLVDAQRVTAVGSAYLDDRLFIDLAASISQGDWLGSYSARTLAKGPAYSIFIALTHAVHLPLPVAQQLLYAGACAAFAYAISPLFRLRFLPVLLFAVLLFNPMSFETQVMGRVLRQHLSTPATLLALAGGCGLWFYVRKNYYLRLAWASISGLALAASWLSREESILIFPAIALLALGGLFAHRHSWRRTPTWILFALPWVILAVSCLTVRLLNKKYYQAAITGEFRTTEFADAYGALTRVRSHDWQPYVPVTHEMRERIYAVSPTFAQLRSYFDGDAGQNWASYGSALTGRPAENREIAGGWFMWALRDAVAETGHAANAKQALVFYRQMADEINAACNDGRLDALPPRSGFVPPWNPAYRRPWLDAVASGFKFTISFDQFSARAEDSSGDEESLELFRKYTGAKLAPAKGQPWDYTSLERARLRGLESIAKIYQQTQPWLLVIGLLGTLAIFAWPDRQERIALGCIQAALAGTVGLSLAAIAFIHVSSFPAIITGYFHGSYPLVLGFTVFGLMMIIEFVWRRTGNPDRQGAS